MVTKKTIKDPKTLLSDILKLTTPPSLLMVTAPDSLRPNRIHKKLMEIFYANKSFSPETFDSTNLSTKDLVKINDSLLSTSLFSSCNLILIKLIDSLPAKLNDGLLEILASNLTSPISLWIYGKPLPARSKIRKFFEKNSLLLEFAELKGLDLKRFIEREFKSSGVSSVPNRLVDYLVQSPTLGLDDISGMIEHSALYSNNGKITQKEFETLFPSAPQQNEFELLDLLKNGNASQIESALHRLWASGKNPFMLISLLTRAYGRYVAISSMMANKIPIGQIRTQLGMQEWIFKKHLEIVKIRPLPKLFMDLQSILKADSKLKNRSLGQAEIFSELFSKLQIKAKPSF